jgi:lipoate synthase
MNHNSKSIVYFQKPDWLKRRLPTGPAFEQIKGLIGRDRLHTVCQEAKCPNIWECFYHAVRAAAGSAPCRKVASNRLIRTSRLGSPAFPGKWD